MPQRAGEERWLWLYGQLRAAILDRRLRPGARMPSSRNLAKQHGVSRGTVVAAFDHLRSEGYVEMRVGAGAFVATTIPDEAIAVTKRKVGDTRKQTTRATLSKRGLLSAQDVLPLPASHSLGKAFRAWEPAIDRRQDASPDGGSSPGYCPFEERARDLGRQTSTASTGRRGLAWADSFG